VGTGASRADAFESVTGQCEMGKKTFRQSRPAMRRSDNSGPDDRAAPAIFLTMDRKLLLVLCIPRGGRRCRRQGWPQTIGSRLRRRAAGPVPSRTVAPVAPRLAQPLCEGSEIAATSKVR